ncbi:MAG: Fic family protein [Rickettsiales bacterium]|jgi:Fic family protein
MAGSILKSLELKKELDQLRPIDPEQEARIMQKLRLDWNYHSNALEGNSLTYGETKMLLLHGITIGGKPFKDAMEITGHNEAINLVQDVVRQNHPLTENFIRELHTLILKEAYQIDVQTQDGSWVKKTVKIGQYKTEPNSVETKTGEMFYFAEPFAVPSKMNDLINHYRREIIDENFNPIILAAKFHHDFILIHPFDDGNGRTARILMNFILMQFGFPPAIIKTGDKENYFAALRQADGDDLEPFIQYIAENVVQSLEIMIKGAKGEDIEEPSDLDKKLAILEARLKSKAEKGEITKSKEAILEIFDDSITRFFNKSVEECGKFDRFYCIAELYLQIAFFTKSKKALSDQKESLKLMREFIENNDLKAIGWSFEYKKPKEIILENADFIGNFRINFYEVTYEITIHGQILEKNYNQQFSDEEIDKIIKIESRRHLKQIEDKIK